MKPVAKLALSAYVIVATLQVLSRIVDNDLLSNVTKPLLLPLLMVFVSAQVGWRADSGAPWLIIGQFFSFLGDVALMFEGDQWFALGLAMFLVTHICYLVGFFGLGAAQALRDRRWVLLAYPAFWLIANALLWPGLGSLRIPIAVYSAALVAMAMVAMSLQTKLGIGGALFMISDLLIGAGVAYGDFTGQSVAVMSTYVTGQGLIAVAWVQIIGKRTATADALARTST
ncbi:MAG: lysoplasmalogenase [Candidatus Nanopelagicales bacterium]